MHLTMAWRIRCRPARQPVSGRESLLRRIARHHRNDVIVYANATILGGKTVIGHHAVIGSNVWLTDSVAPFTVVAMEKPSLRFKDSADSRKLDFVADYSI